MKLVKMKCPSCNSNLEFEEGNKNVVCNYCHTPLVIDDETIKVEHTIKDNAENKKAKSAEAYIKFEEYIKAFNMYEELSEEYPYEADYWFKLIVCITENFSVKDFLSYEDATKTLMQCDNYFDKYVVLEKNTKLKIENEDKYKNYKDEVLKVYKEDPVEETAETTYVENNESPKKKSSKGFIIAVVIFVIFIALVFANSNKETDNNAYNYSGNDNREVTYDEPTGDMIINKETKVEDIKRIKGKVNVYMFYGNGCHYCENAFEWLETIYEDYGDKFDLYAFEVWYNEDNSALIEKFGNATGEKPGGVPYFVIGDKVIAGFADSLKENILNAIESGSDSSYDVYFDKVRYMN